MNQFKKVENWKHVNQRFLDNLQFINNLRQSPREYVWKADLENPKRIKLANKFLDDNKKKRNPKKSTGLVGSYKLKARMMREK